MKGLWFTELQTPDIAISCLTNATLYFKKSAYQEVAVIDTTAFGRVLILDGVIQTSTKDEFIYHEMITHVPLNAHPDPKRVLIIGGGDGGSLREVTKHSSLEKATLVEIDEEVIKASKTCLPELASGFDHPRAEIIIADGIEFVHDCQKMFDLIIIDSTDPVGPAEGLFSLPFYKSAYNALAEDGILVAQTESVFFEQKLIKRVTKDLSSIFPIVYIYTAVIPTYPGGLWSFTLASKKYNPLVPAREPLELKTRYYSPQIHRNAFILPPFAQNLVRKR